MPSHQQMSSTDLSMVGKPKIEKINVKVEPIVGGITIADLYRMKSGLQKKLCCNWLGITVKKQFCFTNLLRPSIY